MISNHKPPAKEMPSVIFDMDGVLVETDNLFATFLSTHLHDLGVPASFDIAGYRGVTSFDQWKLIKQTFGLRQSVEELLFDARKKYLAYLERIPVIEASTGVRECVQRFKNAGVKMAVASSANPIRITVLLKRIELDWAFTAIVSADDVTRGKPAPDCFLLAADRLGVEPNSCVVVEDAYRGIIAAHAARMRCIGYKSDPKNLDDLSAADLVIDSFDTLTVDTLLAVADRRTV